MFFQLKTWEMEQHKWVNCLILQNICEIINLYSFLCVIGDQLTAPLHAMISLKKVDIFKCVRKKTEFIFSLTQHALYVEKLKNKLPLYAWLLSTAAREV